MHNAQYLIIPPKLGNIKIPREEMSLGVKISMVSFISTYAQRGDGD